MAGRRRAILIVMDSFGIGGAPDAAAFGDAGSDTYGHIRAATGQLALPNLEALGLADAWALANGVAMPDPSARRGFWGAASEVSRGKDTPSGHWEICGLPVSFDWGYFPQTRPAFPQGLIDAICRDGGIEGTLANCHASGTEVIAEFGDEHVRTGKPIVYTSVDSVLQIAAHEAHFGLERLYRLCEAAKPHTDALNIGRVIARPFIGNSGQYVRTGNRRDYAIPPTGETMLDRIAASGGHVIAVGKVGDIMAHRAIADVRKASGNQAIGEATLKAVSDAGAGDLVFANFVDFDMLYGHRRDVAGYASALQAFDHWLPGLLDGLADGDLLVITADHGCDPTWTGTDHTRERVPVLGMVVGAAGPVSIGLRNSFADIAQTICAHLGVQQGAHGVSFLTDAGGSDA